MSGALVVFESMFGNTEQVARAVAAELAARFATTCVDVAEAPAAVPADVALLVVGGPTHAFGLTKPATRRDAVRQAGLAGHPVGDKKAGLRDWLDELVLPREGLAAAAFDTKLGKPRLPGSAARAAERRLERRGARMVLAAETFHVTGTAGPLATGEEQRARDWGRRLAAATAALLERPRA